MAQKKEITPAIEVKMIKLEDIKPPVNPIRSKADEEKMEELIDSIRRFGLINPISVYPRGKMYEIFAGHRRFIACKALGLDVISANVRTADETQRDIMKLHENIVREDVNPIDQAHYFKYMIEKYKYTHDEFANMIGKSRPYVSNIMRTLSYPDYIQEAIEKGDLTYNVASILCQVEDEGTFKYYAEYAIRDGISQDTAKKWVENWKLAQEAKKMPDTPSENQEPSTAYVYHPPTCHICGKDSREVPLESILWCVRCRVDILEMIRPAEKKES